jgi:hypothetical protein
MIGCLATALTMGCGGLRTQGPEHKGLQAWLVKRLSVRDMWVGYVDPVVVVKTSFARLFASVDRVLQDFASCMSPAQWRLRIMTEYRVDTTPARLQRTGMDTSPLRELIALPQGVAHTTGPGVNQPLVSQHNPITPHIRRAKAEGMAPGNRVHLQQGVRNAGPPSALGNQDVRLQYQESVVDLNPDFFKALAAATRQQDQDPTMDQQDPPMDG